MLRLRPNLTSNGLLPETILSPELPGWGQPIASVILAAVGLILFGMGMPGLSNTGINRSAAITRNLDQLWTPDLPSMPLVRSDETGKWDSRHPAPRVDRRIRHDMRTMTCPRSGHDLAAAACEAASRLAITGLSRRPPDNDDRMARALFVTTPLPAGESCSWIGRQPEASTSGREDDRRWDLMELAGAQHKWPLRCPCPIYPRGHPAGEPR